MKNYEFKKCYRVGYNMRWFYGVARGVVVIVVGNEHGDSISNPGRD